MVDGPRADPVVLTRYADFLSDDGREHRKARKLYEQALDRMPTHAAAWAGLAGTTWQRGKRPLARELSFFAASSFAEQAQLSEHGAERGDLVLRQDCLQVLGAEIGARGY